MARERYLVGVSQEELKYTPPPQTPMTPKGWFSNLWYHHKWGLIIGSFTLAAVTVIVLQMILRVKPDYQLCMATDGFVPESVITYLETELATCGTDLNGDGTVVVSIQSLNISPEHNYTLASTNQQALTAHYVARDVSFFAFSPNYYQNTLCPLMEGQSFFVPLGVTADGMSEDGTYWNWKNSPLLKEQTMTGAPQQLYFGVRSFGENPKKTEEKQSAESLTLLQSFIQKHTAS